jgi:hypothetical protein
MSKGELILNGANGKIKYEVEMVNGFMKLTGKDGVFYLREDSKPDIVSRLKREISEMRVVVAQKKAIIELCETL